MNNTIFIFTASWGNGHNTAAEGLREAEEKKGNRCEVFNLTNVSFFAKVITGAWEIASRFPLLWKSISSFGNTETPSPLLKWILKKAFLPFLRQCFQSALPDTIFLTNPLFSEVIDEALPKKIQKTIILTDYYRPHLFWTWGESETIVCLDQHAKEYLQRHVPEKTYTVAPFPLPERIQKAKTFSEEEKNTVRESFGASPETPILTFFFHHFLSGKEQETFLQYWEIYRHRAVYLCLAGKNEKYLKKILPPFPEIHILPWTEDMAKIYAITNIAIGKGGGALISECQALNIPLEIYAALPGQEAINKQYWEEEVKAGRTAVFPPRENPDPSSQAGQ